MIFGKLSSGAKRVLGRFDVGRYWTWFAEKRDSLKSDRDELQKSAGKSGLSPSRTVLLLLWGRKGQIILLTLAAFLLLCGFFAFNSRNSISTTMSLNYGEASNGLNPNSTRFNMYELASNEVMERAISYMGVPDLVTPEEMSSHISIATTNSKAINTTNSEYFISTSFNVNYTKNRQVKDMSTADMMHMICKAYNDYFHESYGDKRTALLYNDINASDMEYVEISDDMARQADRMEEYVHKRVKENGTFKSEETGETFQSLEKMFQNLADYDISKYRAFVLESGLARDKDKFIDTLYYKNSVLDMQYQKSMADYSVRQNTISMYDESMIGTVMIPAVNERDDYYMSRTNIGIDYLAREAEDHLINAKDTLKEIEINTDIIQKLEAGNPTVEDFNTADQMIEDIRREFNKLSQIAMTTDREYIKYKTKDYITFQTRERSLAEKVSIKKTAALTVVIFLIICVVFWNIEKYKLRNRGVSV